MLPVIPDFVWGSIFLYLPQYSDALRAHLRVESRWLLLKWTALLHDIGKPLTKTVEDDGRTRFFEHEDLGAQLAEERLRALRFSNSEIERITGIIGGHMRPHWLAEGPLTRRAMYRFFRDTKDYGADILLLSMADHLATHGPEVDLHTWVERLGLIGQMFDVYFSRHEEVVAPPPLVNGNDIMRELDLPPGKQIGVILEAIREAQASGEVMSKEGALVLARRVLDGRMTNDMSF
jgi:putative nucleotidyltransferase with HDIG domain